MALLRLLVNSLVLASLAIAGFPPKPEGVKTISTKFPGVTISYKQTTICETQAKAWAGYVNMPVSYLSDIETSDPYSISMFFWYFEAREDPENAPTGIYLAGGPGQSSLYGVGLDGGPCYVNPDSNSTSNNPYSMTNKVNMLYVDQPVGTGFSYDLLVKSTLDLTFHGNPPETGIVAFEEWGDKLPAENSTFLYGILPSQNPLHTANTTGVAAVTMWNFAQVWFSEFPEYTTSNKGVSIWGNSYGGYWVTAFGAYIAKQNAKILSGQLPGGGTVIDVNNIGFTNGCVDQLYQAEWYIHLAYDNVYDLQVISKSTYEGALKDFFKPKGCLDLIGECQELGALYDPQEFGMNKTVNELCLAAEEACIKDQPYDPPTSLKSVGFRSVFDMAHMQPDPYPPSYLEGFFNQDWVQKDLGVPINFTANSNLVEDTFISITGDAFRRAGMKDVEYLLDNGVKVTFMYGDRDFRCPWLGMEKLSLAANWTGADAFRAAGYATLVTNSSYNGGVVRQHGNLSFSRVFQAGHDAYPYQPQTIYNIFNRAIFNTDIATGTIPTGNNYSTTGPSSSESIKEKLPPPPPVNCYLWDISTTCTSDQLVAIEEGKAEIVDFTVKSPAGGGVPIAYLSSSSSSSSGGGSGSGTSAADKSGALGMRDGFSMSGFVLMALCWAGVVAFL